MSKARFIGYCAIAAATGYALALPLPTQRITTSLAATANGVIPPTSPNAVGTCNHDSVHWYGQSNSGYENGTFGTQINTTTPGSWYTDPTINSTT